MAESITFDVLARDRASATFNRIARSTETLESRFTRFQRSARNLATSLVGVEVGKSVLDAADKFELSRSRLETITKNIGANFGELSKQIGATDAKMERFGFTNADTEGSLAALESVTKNPAKAMKDLALAADIARGRNISLGEATLILQRVETGHVAQLAKLGIATKDASGHLLTQQQVLQSLTDLYGGSASAYVDTFAGKQAALRAEFQDTAAQIGVALLPAAVDLAKTLQHDVLPPIVSTAQWLDRNRSTIEPLVKAVLIGVAAWKTYGVALRITTELTKLFGTQATTTAAKVAAASAEEAASARATAAAFRTEGAAIGAAMAGNLNTRGVRLAGGLLRNAGTIAGAGAVLGGSYLGGQAGSELNAAGYATLVTAPLSPPIQAFAAAVAAFGVWVHGLPSAGDVGAAYKTQAASGPTGRAAVQSVATQTAPNSGPYQPRAGAGTVNQVHQLATAALQAAAAQRAQAAAASDTATAEQLLARVETRTADQIATHAQRTLNFTQAQDSLRQAMHAAAQTAVDNGRALTGNSDAALANRQALDAQVTGILNVIDVMKQNGSSANTQASMLDILTTAVEQNATKIYGDRDAVDKLLRELGLLPDAVANAAAALATLPDITQAAFSGDNVTPGALHQLNQAATKAKATGEKVGKSFADGYSPVVSKATTEATNKATEAFNKLKDKITSDLQSIRDAIDSTRSTVAGFADFSAQGTDALGASGANTDVAGQLKAKAARLEQFARYFTQLDRDGLDAHLMAQFAQIGPDAIPAMQALLHSGRRGIGRVNRIEQRIQTAAGSVATTAVGEQYGPTIHKDLTGLPGKIGQEFRKGLRDLHINLSAKEIDYKNGVAVVISP